MAAEVSKKITDRDYSLNFLEVLFGLGSSGKLVTVYYPFGKHCEEVGIFWGNNGSLDVDHLPVTGYSYSSWYAEDYGEKIVVLKNKIFSFKETRFLEKGKIYDILNLEDGTVKSGFVHIEYSGMGGSRFNIDYDNSVVRYANKDYGEKFVIINPDAKVF